MGIRENEQDRQAYLTKRMNDADIATREYVNLHAREIGVAEGYAKGYERGLEMGRILSAQHRLKQPLTPKEELRKLSLADRAAIADQLERQLLPPNEAS